MEKELRKSYRLILEKLVGVGVELEALDTPENQELLRKFPIDDGLWRHPQAHILERVSYFLDCTKKSISKIIEALPRERKPKNIKKVDWDGKNNEKTKKPRSSKADRVPPEGNRKSKNKTGISGDGDLKSEAGPPVEKRKRGRPRKV